jgi:hypothetical protein
VVKFVDRGWNIELAEAAHDTGDGELLIISPFIKVGALQGLLSAGNRPCRVITRFKLSDMSEHVSDLASLQALLRYGAKVRGVKNLHSKLFVFGTRRAIITSANLTGAALERNHEFGIVADDASVIRSCIDYFEQLWSLCSPDLKQAQIDEWGPKIIQDQATGVTRNVRARLGDYGVNLHLPDQSLDLSPAALVTAVGSRVKLLGTAKDRLPLDTPVLDIIREGCHTELCYPRDIRPRRVKDGSLMFIGRMTRAPNDVRIFGQAIALQHQEGRDDASPAEIEKRPWKKNWPHYIRIHTPVFIAGSLQNAISLNDLMASLQSLSFASTKRNAIAGKGNVNPRRSYTRQADVALSDEGRFWLTEQFQSRLVKHGRVPQADLESIA